MPTNPKVERVLARVEPGRRDAMRRMLVTAAYAAPVVASFSMDSLAAAVGPFCGNQTMIGAGVANAELLQLQRCEAVPATSPWTLVAMAGALSAAGAWLLRHRRAR